MPPSSRRTKRRKSLLLLRSSKGGGLAPDTPSRLRSPDHQRKKPSHFPTGFSVDFSRSLHFRHGFAHLAGVSGADPGRTAGSFSSECPGGGAPARKRWGGTGVPGCSRRKLPAGLLTTIAVTVSFQLTVFDTGAPAPQSRGRGARFERREAHKEFYYGRRTYSKDHG